VLWSAKAQLASACQSRIRQSDAVAALHPHEARPDQGVKGRALALLRNTASPPKAMRRSNSACSLFQVVSICASRARYRFILLRRLIPGKGA
jgi:hypothetical protein